MKIPSSLDLFTLDNKETRTLKEVSELKLMHEVTFK
jgi:hypothetical protein